MAGFSSKRRKIRQPDSEFPLLKCHKTQNDLEDWIGIGKLPDEILVSILSLLPMKQAIRTSVLTRRWRYLWTSITRLEFDDLSVNYLLFSQPRSPSPTPFDMCAPLEPTYPPFLVKRRRFVDWVNQVLNLHKGSHVEEFSLEFSVYGHYFKSDIDSWINFAFQKRVKGLHLIFTCTWASTQRSYTLTPPMLRNYRLDSLVQLHLCYVEVTGEVLECFLSACPLLEFLSVSDSHVMNFKISGPSLKLKQLEITYCTLTSLDIYAVNLMSFKYVGNHGCISWKHTPPLVNAHFGGPYASYIIKSFFQFQSYLSQLETLVLDLGFQKLTCFPKLPKLRNLKQLELQLNYRVFCLLLCTSLLRASPSLNRFKIKVNILTFESFNCVKIEHPVNSSKSEELALTTFTVEVPYSIPNNSQCSVKVMSHKSPVGDEVVEVAYEGEDEHEENSPMKKNYSDFDLSAHEDLSGDKDSGLSNANADFSYPSDTLVKEQFDDKDSEKGVDMIQTGHISDPGVGKAEFWSSPKLKRSCSNVETRYVLRKIADLHLPPSKSQSFEQLQELSEKVRQNIDPGSPKSVMTHCSADRVMLKKRSSSQVLPSRSRRLWWKLFLWSHRNLHNASWAMKSHSPPTRAVLNPQGGYSSDTLEPNQTMELGKMASPGSFTGESLNKGDNNNNNNGNKSWNAFQNGASGLWPQNQWVAFSSDSSPFARVDEWVKGLETQYPLPVIDNYENDEGITFPPSPETGKSPARSPTHLTRQHDINFTEEILHANSVIESLNSSSTVAHISGIGLKAIPIISSFLSLRSVNLSNNFIVQITPGSLPKGLHTLNLSRNKITTIEGLRELTRLRVLDISYNRISRIGHGLSNCTLIKELYVAGNKISDVEGLHRLLKLTVLDLSFNKITTTKALGQLVANYHTLQALNLLGNPIQSNISDDQLRKAVCDLLPKLAYLNKQPIKPQRARELLTDSVAKAALGNRSSRKKAGKRTSQSKSFSASGHKSSASVAHKSKNRSKSQAHRQMSLMKAPAAEASTSH